MSSAFDMADLGRLSFSLGIEFIFQPSGILLTQRQYIRDMLQELGLTDCRPVPTPILEKQKLTPNMDSPPSDPLLYQKMVGKLIFLTQTRPDISYAVSIVSRFMTKPLEIHYQAVKHLYRYLKGTTDLAIQYQRGGGSSLSGFTDSDWAGDSQDRKSTMGYVFLLGNSPITWNSKKQPTVALSSTEAEYMSLTESTKEAIWLRRLFKEIGTQQNQDPTPLFGDNQGSINLAHNPIYHGRTKHIEVLFERKLHQERSLWNISQLQNK